MRAATIITMLQRRAGVLRPRDESHLIDRRFLISVLTCIVLALESHLKVEPIPFTWRLLLKYFAANSNTLAPSFCHGGFLFSRFFVPLLDHFSKSNPYCNQCH